ncbi:MAG TPA: sigma-70 family RNA polymerase sigma factor [Candidatus Manganitrophaceae bacterium]|nr:sigma-70 family RNA polymerase sigma factor [Candidatus Manganitrophaceae bacterium]
MSDTVEDREFFEREVTALRDQLFGAAMRLAKNRQDAEDLVAEAVAKAWAGLETLKEKGRFRPWVFRILTNAFISDYRKEETKTKKASLDEERSDDKGGFSLFEELHQPFLLWWNNPEKEFLNKLLREDIERAVDALPGAFRVAVILSDLEGFSYEEISEILKIPVGTVRSRLARGRSLLQKALWDHAKEAGLIKEKDAAGGKRSASRHAERKVSEPKFS